MEQLINRVRQILLKPKEEWEVIAKEETPIAKLLTGYILPLSLIGVVASFIGFGLIGVMVPWFGRVATIEWGLYMALIHVITVFAGVVLSGWIISVLAPSFGIKLGIDDGVKLVGYAYTPVLIAAVFNIIPGLAILAGLLGLYGLFLLYLGFKPITKIAEDKLTGYFLFSLLVMIVVFIILQLVLTAIFPTGPSIGDFSRGWGL